MNSNNLQNVVQKCAFQMMVGGFILVSSFLYGLSAGLTKGHNGAAAANEQHSLFHATQIESSRLIPPTGVIATPFGENMRVNNHAAEMLSFFSNRPAGEIIEEQSRTWKAQGLKVVATTGRFKGSVLALKGQGEKRYLLTAWTVPEKLQPKVSGGYPTQGKMSAFEISPADEALLEGVPGVPLKPGGKGGAVVSSNDPGGRTWSSVYTLPGDVRDNIDYYRSELRGDGWEELDAQASRPGAAEFEVGSLAMSKQGEQIILLFSPLLEEGEDLSPRTGVAITRGPLNIEQWRQLD